LIHAGSKELDEQDQACVNAAERFKLKIKYETRKHADWARSQIQSAIGRAEEASLDSAGSVAIYRSIIELYENVEWAEDLVKLAKARLAERKEKTESNK
jgi:ABC-type uncharacterized transport system auxiliary subunit